MSLLSFHLCENKQMYKLIIGVTNIEACSKSKLTMSLVILCYNMGGGANIALCEPRSLLMKGRLI